MSIPLMSERLPFKITIGDKYGPAMEIDTQEEADRYFERCVQHTMSHGKNRADAGKIERQSLGYYAGYYDEDTRQRVERLFSCAHPVFGAIATNGSPTSEEAFTMLARGLVAAREEL